jgi:hypothetical protein
MPYTPICAEGEMPTKVYRQSLFAHDQDDERIGQHVLES